MLTIFVSESFTIVTENILEPFTNRAASNNILQEVSTGTDTVYMKNYYVPSGSVDRSRVFHVCAFARDPLIHYGGRIPGRIINRHSVLNILNIKKNNLRF